MNSSINYLELLTIWKHFGGTKLTCLMDLAAQIWRHCFATDTRLLLTYIPSKFNPVDPLYRNQLRQLEWSLSTATFNMLNSIWGPMQVDCFASQTNHKLPKYISWTWDLQAIGTDAMLIDWRKLRCLYLCPQWNLILPVVNKRNMVSNSLQAGNSSSHAYKSYGYHLRKRRRVVPSGGQQQLDFPGLEDPRIAERPRPSGVSSAVEALLAQAPAPHQLAQDSSSLYQMV
ncbi:hypothetical protein MUCCIDRAFT_107410 [Mucor lusitanicus CBS 277.49]|uniref:Uncharacterized protein n=1 Tax=Mucor lusitanicus CBS 277.49 TaxID=747725 RepID=A0A168NW11_MUCCL|nr:hypothetical protein MUCCIDRAFT_107410 [Mucor lusitanicus CBS 277.49]